MWGRRRNSRGAWRAAAQTAVDECSGWSPELSKHAVESTNLAEAPPDAAHLVKPADRQHVRGDWFGSMFARVSDPSKTFDKGMCDLIEV